MNKNPAPVPELDLDALDGADILTVLEVLADSQEITVLSLLDSHLAQDIINATQSNPDRSMMIIREWARL